MICRLRVNGVDDYSIDIRWNGAYYTLHPLIYPANRRGGGAAIHHLYDSGEICVAAGKNPTTLDRAKAISMLWAEGWSKYVRTGIFPNGAQKLNVKS